jgi:small subunit ribosomal protein S17
MTEENVNQDETNDVADAAGAEPETTDAAEGGADAENVSEEAAPDGAAEPAAGAEPPETEPATEEPAPAGDDSPAAEVAAEEPAAAGTTSESPTQESAGEEQDAVAETEGPVEPADSVDASAQDVAGEPLEPAAAAQPQSAPKKKKKRLPRPLRRQRTKTTRERPTERKPLTRLAKPEHARGRRQERQGTVVSAASDKTIVVRVDTVKVHPMYKKVIRRSTKLHAHDEGNEAKPGDIVRIVETRPLSKQKRWRLQEIVEAAK